MGTEGEDCKNQNPPLLRDALPGEGDIEGEVENRCLPPPPSLLIDTRAVIRLELAIIYVRRQVMAEERRKSKAKIAGGLLIPAGLFMGMGIGWALDHMVQGLFIGMGAGFLLYAAVVLMARD